MDDKMILENDLRKIHAEVNQIVSQRFQLTTLAILVFAGVCGWAATGVARPGGVTVEVVSLVTLLLILVLGCIFAYFMRLLGMMRVFTIYLEEKYGSHWETDWREYRHDSQSRTYWGYSKASTAVFVALGPLVFAFMAALAWLSGNLAWQPLLWLPIAVLVVYVHLVIGASWARHRLIDEDAIRRNWQHAIREAAAKRGDADSGA